MQLRPLGQAFNHTSRGPRLGVLTGRARKDGVALATGPENEVTLRPLTPKSTRLSACLLHTACTSRSFARPLLAY